MLNRVTKAIREDYFLLKTVRVIGAAVLLGSGAGIAFLLVAHLRGEPREIAGVARTVVLAHFLFTATALPLQPCERRRRVPYASILPPPLSFRMSRASSAVAMSRPRPSMIWRTRRTCSAFELASRPWPAQSESSSPTRTLPPMVAAIAAIDN